MPIYEYRCAKCNAYYKHLARTYLAPAPLCPRCGYEHNTRLVSSANVVHGSSYHEQNIKSQSAQIAGNDMQQAARVLQESGRLEDSSGMYGSDSYKELVYRRSNGAGEADVSDLVDDLAQKMQTSDATKMAGAMMFSKEIENRIGAEGPPDEHEEDAHHHTASNIESSEQKDNLGWVSD